ncbi:pyridoxamine 5'-phosphate oxidase family protein [Alkalihalophilus sp. As8PL]|uniref:Pyridoxamine 5'-phosphate oxidase family protein n=1 Tax=Alkalihalophilus sp. As8PL TaxID=3237103 RepID=A0AB39BV57_9BACI
MKVIRNRGSVDMEHTLSKPLFAHLATVEEGVPKDSPVWFLWEEEHIWIIGSTSADRFPHRLKQNPTCAIGIIDYEKVTGKVVHIGFRGKASVEPFDGERAERLLRRYLGPNQDKWDPRFKTFNEHTILVRVKPETLVVRDQSYNV